METNEFEYKKNKLRKDKAPYFYEMELIKRTDYSLKEFELFDGNKLYWGFKESNNVHGESISKMTPLYENIVEILYLDGVKLVFKYRGKNGDALGIIDSSKNDQDFLSTVFVDKEEVVIDTIDDNIICVRFKVNGVQKCIYYDLSKTAFVSNAFDVIYMQERFLKSYQVGNKRRVFIGMLDKDNYTVKNIGYDINRKSFINFPLTKDGFINENEMKKMFARESEIPPIDNETYKEIDKKNLVYVLTELGVSTYDSEWYNVLMELYTRNNPNQKIK